MSYFTEPLLHRENFVTIFVKRKIISDDVEFKLNYSRAHLVKGTPQAGYTTQKPFGLFCGFAALASQKIELVYILRCKIE